MDSQPNSRREEVEDDDNMNLDTAANGGEEDCNDNRKDLEALPHEPTPLSSAVAADVAVVENPSAVAENGNLEFSEEKPKIEPIPPSDSTSEEARIVQNPEIAETPPLSAADVAVVENPSAVAANVNLEVSEEEPKIEPIVPADSTSEEAQIVQNPEIAETPLGSAEIEKISEEDDEPSPKKQKHLSVLTPQTPETEQSEAKSANGNGSTTHGKKSKKKSKSNNVWNKPASRKGKKKAKNNNNTTPKVEDTVLITPVPRFPSDKSDDSPEMKICLSKVYKAEKVELSDDRMCAGSCKGYRMVRATRGVSEGAWYFEIKVVSLGETGHTRLGWSTEKGDLQAPVGYDGSSFGYRDVDGSKVHKALREKYGEEGYKEGDVIGFYISLPEGNLYVPKSPHLVWFKGQKYFCGADAKEDPPKIVPGSEISFFRNGVCQGVAFKDFYGGRYYPAASMYTLPNQPNCLVKFNFGPDFECPPDDFEGRPLPRPMIEVPYRGFENPTENGESSEKIQ